MDTDILEAALKIFPRKKDYGAMPDILFGTKRRIGFLTVIVKSRFTATPGSKI